MHYPKYTFLTKSRISRWYGMCLGPFRLQEQTEYLQLDFRNEILPYPQSGYWAVQGPEAGRFSPVSFLLLESSICVPLCGEKGQGANELLGHFVRVPITRRGAESQVLIVSPSSPPDSTAENCISKYPVLEAIFRPYHTEKAKFAIILACALLFEKYLSHYTAPISIQGHSLDIVN